MRKSRITISQPNEATESVRRQKKRTHRRWYTGRTEGGGGSAGKQAASENHLKLPQLNKITAGKQKVHQKDSGHSCNVFSFSLSPSPSPSIFHFPLHLPFLSPTYTCIYTLSSHAWISSYFSTSISMSPSAPPHPSSFPRCNTFSFFFFSGRELGPSLGCCWLGLLAAK